MFSYQELQVIDVVARRGSFSAAAEELHRVPSAISYTVRQVEERLAVTLFTRLHRQVEPTVAGKFFVEQARELINRMEQVRFDTQRVANGWQATVTVALDNVVREDQVSVLVNDFYQAFPDVELLLSMEVFNGVWDALSDNRADIAIGATTSVPVSGNFGYRNMGTLEWRFVASKNHPLASASHVLSDAEVARYPAICLEDTSRIIPKRTTWLLDNQRRIVVPNWHSAMQCFLAGTGIGVVPSHMALPHIESGLLVEKQIETPPPASPCCIAWNKSKLSPALNWLLEYLGDSDQLHNQWLR